jgi:hypothetical protein
VKAAPLPENNFKPPEVPQAVCNQMDFETEPARRPRKFRKNHSSGSSGTSSERERQPGGVVEERERLWNGQAEKLKQH